MPGPIPTAGYASRTEAVLSLRKNGCSTKFIATTLGIAEKSVSALENSALRSRAPGTKRKRLNRFDATTTVFPNEVRNLAAPHAFRRNISINELFRRIVESVIDDNMVDAVLDDREAA